MGPFGKREIGSILTIVPFTFAGYRSELGSVSALPGPDSSSSEPITRHPAGVKSQVPLTLPKAPAGRIRDDNRKLRHLPAETGKFLLQNPVPCPCEVCMEQLTLL